MSHKIAFEYLILWLLDIPLKYCCYNYMFSGFEVKVRMNICWDKEVSVIVLIVAVVIKLLNIYDHSYRGYILFCPYDFN